MLKATLVFFAGCLMQYSMFMFCWLLNAAAAVAPHAADDDDDAQGT